MLIPIAFLFIDYVAQETKIWDDSGWISGRSLCQVCYKLRVLTICFTCVQADEAEATYKTCIADATTQQLELEHTKVTVLRQLQDVIKQSDQTIRSVRAKALQLQPHHRSSAQCAADDKANLSSCPCLLPPGHYLILPADAHAYCGPACPLPDSVWEQ